MTPKQRNPENKGLPNRWRYRHGAYYFQVPPGMEHKWDGKKEFRLGDNLAEAYRVYADRIEVLDHVNTMSRLIDRYSVEILPTKALRTQIDESRYIKLLREIFGDNNVSSITPQDCYKLRDHLTRKRGATTANRVIGLLSHIFTKSIEWGARADHPIVGKVKKNRIQVKRHIPEDWEINEALTVAPPLIKAYIRLKLLTGLRMTDMLSIKLSDIKEDGIHVTPRKTAKSSGKSLIIQWDENGELRAAIQKAKRLPRPIRGLHLFCTRYGQPYIKENGLMSGFQSIWQRWMKKAVVETGITQSFAEKYLRTKVGSEFDTAEQAAELLGHTSTTTTRKHYREKPSRVLPLTKRKND